MVRRTGGARDQGIYLDYHATTPCDPRVIDVVKQVSESVVGNPSSPHRFGGQARDVIDDARETVADHIGATPGQIVFTSGATECNNIVLRGFKYSDLGGTGRGDNIVISEIEHKSVVKPARSLEDDLEVRTCPVTKDGVVNIQKLEDMVDERTLIISIQAANNEIGTIQPISEVATIAKSYGAKFHCDAAQALGRMEIDVEKWGVDFLSLSAHKAYGPKGIGALYIRGGPDNQPVDAIVLGGGQEMGIRSGTLNVPAIAGFAEACRLIRDCLHNEVRTLRQLRDEFEKEICSRVGEVDIIGNGTRRLPSTTNMWFDQVEAQAIMSRLPNIGISSGSACESGAIEPSHVLRAIGLSRDSAYQCLRVAVGRFTTEQEVAIAADRIVEEVAAVRRLTVGSG